MIESKKPQVCAIQTHYTEPIFWDAKTELEDVPQLTKIINHNLDIGFNSKEISQFLEKKRAKQAASKDETYRNM